MKFDTDESPITVNLVPLLDTIFIILVFFTIILISATFSEIIPVDVPNAESGNPTTASMQTITINKDGEVFFNAEKVTIDALSQRISTVKESHFIVRGDTRTTFGSVVGVLDALGAHGVKNVYFEVAHK